MPRRPVKPEDRQRVARACDQCKASKKRCNGIQPCDACRKKGDSETCHYTRGRRRHPLPRQSSITPQNVGIVDFNSSGNRSSVGESMVSPVSSWNVQGQSVRSSGSVISDGIDVDVFVGNTAAISFLRFLQKTLERHVGPSGFTVADDSHQLFEADTADVDPNSVYDGLSIDDKRAFIQVFLDASSGLLDLYSWEDVFRLLGSRDPISPSAIPPASQRLSNLEAACMYLMIAIGAQCRQSVDDATWAARLFSYARKLAFEGMLANPSLDLVRAFLLMAFYMFGACRRNSAFMYLGVASKAADILGLHSSAQYKHLPQEARNARLRTAKSLRVFDVICNSILGRPSSTPSVRAGYTSYVTDSPDMNPEVMYKALALGASYEISAILNEAVDKSAEVGLSMEATEAFVLALRQRSRTFPPILRHHGSESGFDTRHITIGNVHVAGSYYFSVILVTRHCLIRHVVPLLSGQARNSPRQAQGLKRAKAEDKKVAHLADACIDAASLMSQMCHQVMKSGMLVGNMCILKAWVFATGLVLGFSLLVEDGHSFSQKRAAFLKSLHVLGELKRMSPQAEQYYNILMSFHQSIKSYREQLDRGKQESRPTLVDRVFLTEVAAEVDDAEHIATQLPSPDTTSLEPYFADWPLELDQLGTAGNDIGPVDPALMGDNDIILRMLWDVDRYAGTCLVPLLPDVDMGLNCSAQVGGHLA
ncbi:hypothetical protein P171DRAFT_493328 [Karstenula rhodostoma CBS 690.94]|uniref:Zn(2)-C6 fungal-type domain-containing protein n=1 Tax=Karstenula rhodostoma CBS 690.94 TaxID=1392251 RepID=A0A9P4PWK0_9PLEO|nr:hypothetical protein P171DRAFT_493328 [Karstenula rhodostoma CBS 690.94]